MGNFISVKHSKDIIVEMTHIGNFISVKDFNDIIVELTYVVISYQLNTSRISSLKSSIWVIA